MLLLLAVLGTALPQLPGQVQAQTQPLQLQLDESAFKQTSQPRFIDFGRPNGINTQQQLEIISTDGFPVPLRSRCWTVAGGYGLSSVFAAMSGILTEAFTRSGSQLATSRDTSKSAVVMSIGALVGLIPGALLGNEARREEASLNRGVVTLLDVGGTVALGFALNQILNTKPLF